MPSPLQQVVSQLAAASDPRADAQLVAAFLNDTNQDAFAELVRRHGPAVFGVCRATRARPLASERQGR